MTWAEFKEAIERQGVLDSDEVRYIDWRAGLSGSVPSISRTTEREGKMSFRVEN